MNVAFLWRQKTPVNSKRAHVYSIQQLFTRAGNWQVPHDMIQVMIHRSAFSIFGGDANANANSNTNYPQCIPACSRPVANLSRGYAKVQNYNQINQSVIKTVPNGFIDLLNLNYIYDLVYQFFWQARLEYE